MADRVDWHFRQLVTEAELDDSQDKLEQADRDVVADHGLIGVVKNAVVSEHAPTPDLTVDVSAPGIVYTQQGKRVLWSSLQTVDMSVDEDGSATAVASAGNEKWLSLFAAFDRSLSDPRTDGNGDTVFFVRDESFALNVVQGAEAGSGAATKPPLRNDEINLADVLIVEGQTQIQNADINTNRREDAFIFSGSQISLREGTPEEAVGAVMTLLDALHATSTLLSAAKSQYAAGPAWHDGTTNPVATVQAQITKIINDLVANAGSDRVGSEVNSNIGDKYDFAAGSIWDQLLALKGFLNNDIVSIIDTRNPPSGSGGSLVLHKLIERRSGENDGTNTAKTRMFAASEGGIIVTFNANFDNGANNWVADANLAAYKQQIGGRLIFGGPTAFVERLQRRDVFSAGETWGDTSWTSEVTSSSYIDNGGSFFDGVNYNIEDGRIQYKNPTANGSNPAAGSDPGTNAQYAKSICKAWGQVQINSGTVTLEEGFGVSSVAANGTEFDINFHNSFDNNDYSFVSQPWYDFSTGAILVASITARAAGGGGFAAEIRRCDTGATVSIAGVFAVFDFQIYGVQV